MGEHNFDDLMSSLGVRRLEGGSAKKSGKPRRSPSKKGAPAARRAPAPPAPRPVRTAPPERTPVAPAPLPTPPPQARPEPPPAGPPQRFVQDLRDRAAGAEKRAAIAETAADAARAELASLQDRLAAAEAHAARAVELDAEVDALRGQVAEIDAQRRGLQRALSDAQSAPDAPRPLLACMEARGIRGADEAVFALRALDEAHLLGGLLERVAELPGAGLVDYLEDRVSLLGGCEGCPDAGGRAVLQVPRDRCDVCEGSDIRRSVRRFVDACLNNGFTRVTVVGGSPRYHRQLRNLVQHRSLDIRLVPGNTRRRASQAKSDLDGSDAIVLWGGTLLDHATSDLYAGANPKVIRIAHRGIGRMLELAGEGLDRLGDSLL